MSHFIKLTKLPHEEFLRISQDLEKTLNYNLMSEVYRGIRCAYCWQVEHSCLCGCLSDQNTKQ